MFRELGRLSESRRSSDDVTDSQAQTESVVADSARLFVLEVVGGDTVIEAGIEVRAPGEIYI